MRNPAAVAFVLASLLSPLSACADEDAVVPASPPLAPSGEEEAPELEVTSAALSVVDCAESTATGYQSGSPFPITVVTVDGKPVEKATANAYYVMAQAAAEDGIQLQVVSGFRTMAEQQYFYNCYVNCNCNGCALAAAPGYSNHQSGHALDLNTGGWSTARKLWLDAHAASFGFSATVASEHWHWEWWGGGPGGGPCGAQRPDMSLAVRTVGLDGQAADFAPEGSSAAIFDLWEGQEFVHEVIVRNASGGAPTSVDDSVSVDVAFASPYLEPLSYTIYTDWPAFDLATWKVSVADSFAGNPPKTAPPATATYLVEQFAPGEGKKIRFVVRAKGYSIGAPSRAYVRAWVRHVAGYYGEQVGWDDPVEVNHAGGWLRARWEHDVFARDRWEFEGDDPADTEGWTAQHAAAATVLPAEGVLAVTLAGDDPYLVNTRVRVDAGRATALTLAARCDGPPRLAQVFFATEAAPGWDEARSGHFVLPCGGVEGESAVSFAGHPAWSGTVTGLRLDPAPSGADVIRIAHLRAVAAAATSGDADADGHLAAPGPDCDDGAAAVHPGAAEACNGADDDCDGETDEGVANACGGCGGLGAEVCNGVDDDCNGETDEGVANACGGCGDPPAELCNGADDDCDGQTDEGVAGGCAGCVAGAVELCNGRDDDCDGETDEDAPLGAACVAGQGPCAEGGLWACGPDGAFVCAAGNPAPLNAEVCNGQDDDCDGVTDEGDVCAPCLPGATGACALAWVVDGCERGTRRCGADGLWGACAVHPACLGGPGGPDPDADPGADVAATDAGPTLDAGAPPGAKDDGCAGGAGRSAWVAGLALVALVAARARFARRRGR